MKEPYLLTVDDNTGHLASVKCASRKLEAAVEAVLKVKSSYAAYSHIIKSVRSDREAAFIAMETQLGLEGIHLDRTSAGRHAKVAERSIRTIKDHVRAVKAGLPFRLPLDLMQHLVADVVASINAGVNTKTGIRSPRELLTGTKLSVDRLYKLKFGTIAVFKLPKGRLPDDSPRGVYGMVIGRDMFTQGAFKVYLLGTRSIITSDRYVQTELTADLIASINKLADADPFFAEDDIITMHYETPSVTPALEGALEQTGRAAEEAVSAEDDEQLDLSVNPSESVTTSTPTVPIAALPTPTPAPRSTPDDTTAESTYDVAPDFTEVSDNPTTDVVPTPAAPIVTNGRPKRLIKPVKRLDPNPYLRSYDDKILLAEEVAFHVDVRQLEERRGAEAIKHSVLTELKTIFDTMSALTPVLRATSTPLPLHMLHKEKYDSEGVYTQLKSRLVAGGNFQVRDEDMETTSSTVRIQSVFLLLNIASHLKMTVAVIDIKSAYLHAKIKSKNIFGRLAKKYVSTLLELHSDWSEYTQRDGSMLFRVDKALYGLAEAARLWFLHLTALLRQNGYTQSTSDRAVFIRRDGTNRVYIALHVDDMLVMFSKKRMYDELLELLQNNLAGITKQEGNK